MSSTDNKPKNEMECPPGMTMKDGKCVAKESIQKEDTNAGGTTPVGAGTITDASTKTEPPGNKKCPPGTTLGADGECKPSGDVGQAGASTAGPTTPGKEMTAEQFYALTEKLMASHTAYNQAMLEALKSDRQKELQVLAANMGIPGAKKESAAFGVKMEASSLVDDSGHKSVRMETVEIPAKFFENASKMITDNTGGFVTWKIRPEAYFSSLKKGWMNYGSGTAHGKLETKGEAFTISGGDMPQIFSKQVYLIPGGRMRVPIRQFLDTQIIENADRYNWYKVNGFAFDDITSEGSAPTTEEAQTITKVTATPALLRANQTVNYSDIENAPFDLVEAFNRAAALGSLDAEGTDVLDTVMDAVTFTNWVESDGSVITTNDDLAAPGTFQQEAIYAGMQLIQDQGGDTSPGNMWAALHPKPLKELILDVTTEFWAGMGPNNQGSNRLMNTAMGVIENRLGVDIVASNQVTAKNNTTNDTYRNLLAMKGVIGLAVAAELQIEGQRRPDLSAVKVGARHRLKGAFIDQTMCCRMSSNQ